MSLNLDIPATSARISLYLLIGSRHQSNRDHHTPVTDLPLPTTVDRSPNEPSVNDSQPPRGLPCQSEIQPSSTHHRRAGTLNATTPRQHISSLSHYLTATLRLQTPWNLSPTSLIQGNFHLLWLYDCYEVFGWIVSGFENLEWVCSKRRREYWEKERCSLSLYEIYDIYVFHYYYLNRQVSPYGWIFRIF
ncbi:unnamed protein product [Vicia faba]|uniref:Uncharacterized protein n=1 Tax=Vicia faba TaxID=3906 RepID=A0AAV0ZNK0_VICFA|nr:unnamed protein product [Vicia faba]